VVVVVVAKEAWLGRFLLPLPPPESNDVVDMF
jgi:hypothetical protein